MGAAPTGKQVVAALKRKSSVDEVLRNSKKVKGGPVVARKYMRRSFLVAKS